MRLQVPVPEQLLFKICQCFWMLTKVGQDALLWSMQAEAGKRRKFWNIEGLVCWNLGCGSNWLMRFSNSFLPFVQLLLLLMWPSHSAGYRTCRESFLRFLGVGKQRILRTKRRYRGMDERMLKTGHWTGFKKPHILGQLYPSRNLSTQGIIFLSTWPLAAS